MIYLLLEFIRSKIENRNTPRFYRAMLRVRARSRPKSITSVSP